MEVLGACAITFTLTDQIFIKAQRIRSLQENEVRKVNEDETGEFIGIINIR
jgi:hypothetical protein